MHSCNTLLHHESQFMLKLSSFSSSTRSQSFSSITCMEKYVMYGDKTPAMCFTK